MIDGFKNRNKPGVRPADKHMTEQIVVGDHSKDSFETPQAVAAHEEVKPGTTTAGDLLPKQKPKKRSFKEWLQSRTKKQWIIFGIIAALVIAGLAVGAYFLFHKKPTSKATPVVIKKVAPPKPTTVASNLTGLQVDPSVNQRPVTGVMIENSTFARPQSSLNEAGVVFEAVAEGGITRFLALYQDTEPNYIGPVRSVRPYYLQWLLGFDAPIAHVGGSAQALQDIKTWNVKDLDQFANGSYYHRISSREAPHNVYTSMSSLRDLENKKGYTSSTYTGFLRKPEAASKTPNATSIDFNISGPDFNVHYDYDAGTNSYKRSEGGAPHMEVDENGTQVQITPKVPVALVMQQGMADDQHTAYNTLGSGQAFIFQDGIVTQGTWHKDNNTTNFTFTDANNQPIKLNPGQTWISIVGSADRVTYH